MTDPILDSRCLPFYEWLDLPIWVFDVDRMRPAWANDAALAFWQASSLAELLARDWRGAGAVMRGHLDAAMQAQARGVAFRAVWTVPVPGGTVTATLLSRGFRLADGRLALLFFAERPSVIDATALRGVEAVRRTSVLISLHALADGAVLMRNPAALQAFGAGSGTPAAQGDPFAAVFDDPLTVDNIRRVVRAGQGYSGEHELRTLQGARWHAVDARPMLDPVSGLRALQFMASDIGELKAAQRSLEVARHAAEVADAAKVAFLANMSHEIRTPMNGVLGLTELSLRSAELNERQRRFISLAHQSAQGMMVIIDDLLDVARIEAGQMAIDPAPLSVRQCVADALSALDATAQTKGLRLGWRVDAAVPETLAGDATRLRQVLVNLVGNALKFTPVGEVQVEVETRADDALPPDGVRLCISVRDTGIGMTGDELDRIFEPFMQVDASASRRYGGTGLGLTLVARLVALMGGDVHVDSTPGVGSCFQVTLTMRRIDAVRPEHPGRATHRVRPESNSA